MKITKLRFQNLNALAGSWCIDFQHPDYRDHGLFAIVGPTGAGKSTILDAICLALFGQTPRLGNVTKSDNEIMTRHCGHCFAEVEFQVGDAHYRSTWSQSRARQRAHGNLQDAKHELADARSGEILEEKKSRTLSRIEAITHLDFKRFTRSVLLSQGSFAAFLQADANERAEMLQQITGTEIYSEISMAVHQHKKQAEDALKLLQAALDGITLLDDEQLAALQQEHQQRQDEVRQHIEQLQQLQTWQQISQQLQPLRQQQHANQQAWTALQTEQHTFAPQAQRLRHALKAAALQADFRSLSHVRSQQLEVASAMAQLQDAIPQLSSAAQTAAQTWQHSQSQQQQFQQHYVAQQKIWQQVGALDQNITHSLSRVDDAQQQLQALQAQQQQLAQQQTSLTEQLTLEQAAHRALAEQLQHQSSFAQAANQLEAWQAQDFQLHSWRQLSQQQQQQQQRAWQAWQDKQAAQTTQQQHLSALYRTLEYWQQQHHHQQTAITALLAGKSRAEYELEQEHLHTQQRLLATIASLEQHRQQLQNGEACPLCGALAHPYADAATQLPTASATDERLSVLKTLLQQHQDLQQQLREALLHQQQTTTNITTAQTNAEHLTAEVAQLQDAYQLAHSQWQDTVRAISAGEQALQQQWQQSGLIANIQNPYDFDRIARDIKHHLATQQRANAHAQQIQLLHSQLNPLATQQTHLTTLQQQQQSQLQHWQQTWQHQQDERQQLFGDVLVADDEAQWLEGQRQQAQSLQQALTQQQRTTAQLEQTTAQLSSLEHRHSALKQEVNTLEHAWQHALRHAGFADETQWQQQQLPAQECERLQQQQQDLQQRELVLQQRLHDIEETLRQLEAQLDEAHAHPLYQQYHPDDQWPQHIALLQDAVNAQHQRIGALGQQLQQQQLATSRMTEQWQQIEAQQQQCDRWRVLYDLIGSSDGRKYNLFAQSLTFNHLLHAANNQLQRMSDRYVLKQNDSQWLQLEVIDAYQAGAVRSAKNLSGGESFLVSLALALGLSQLSSHTTAIDSLFLDEGFGTLDEEALDTALNALASLQQQGKLIGVISHVPALKERIATQIRVVPTQGGRSVLQGSGVMAVQYKAES